ncbi:MAG: hypothetical protein ACN4E2_01350 [Nitrospinota bacterium]
MDTFKITCPDCNSILVVDKATGKLLESRKPLVENPSSDRFKDGFQKMGEDREKRDKYFDNRDDLIKKKKKSQNRQFEESLKELKKNPPTDGSNIFDDV